MKAGPFRVTGTSTALTARGAGPRFRNWLIHSCGTRYNALMFETIEDHAKRLYPQLAKKKNSWLLIASLLVLVVSVYQLMRF